MRGLQWGLAWKPGSPCRSGGDAPGEMWGTCHKSANRGAEPLFIHMEKTEYNMQNQCKKNSNKLP
jgi:hypothetical protein